MDVYRGVIALLNRVPYNAVASRLVQKSVVRIRDGAVRTRYGYLIDFRRTGHFASGLRALVISGSYERPYFEMLGRIINQGDWVVDIGAHEGYVSLFLSATVGPGGRVFAVEPNPENVALASRNIELNRCSNTELIETAVGDRRGRTSFYCSPDAGANGSLINFSYFQNERIEVDVRTVDDLFGGLERLDFLKIDTEGSELEVLFGGGRSPVASQAVNLL